MTFTDISRNTYMYVHSLYLVIDILGNIYQLLFIKNLCLKLGVKCIK